MSAIQKLPASQRLARFTDEADKIFNHVLGYVIAFTSLVAFADVLGNGKITQYLPWVFWLWVIAQGMCVEFQVFILIRRLPRLWNVNRWMFTGNIAFILCLCLMSVFIGSVFVQHDTGGTIEQAMVALGINHTMFIYARSALAILLVVLIAVDRALDHEEFTEQQQRTEQMNLVNAFEERLRVFTEQQSEHLAQLAVSEQQCRQQLLNTVQEMLATFRETQDRIFTERFATFSEHLSERLESALQAEQQARHELFTRFTEQQSEQRTWVAHALSEHLQRSQVNSRVNTPPVHMANITPLPVNSDNKKGLVHKYLTENPNATVAEIVNATGCSRGYASEQRAVFTSEHSEQQSEHLLAQEGR